MGRPIIVVGDSTSHGGTVVQGSPTATINGIPIGRIGDAVTCPIRGHGTTSIATGDSNMLDGGIPVARHGDQTACGAVLISSQRLTTNSD